MNNFQFNLRLDYDVALSKEFWEIKRRREANQVINKLLREHLQIKETDEAKLLKEIEEKLSELQIQKDALIVKKSEDDRRAAEEAAKWRYI